VGHVWEFRKSWQSPKICGALVPRGIKFGSHCRAKFDAHINKGKNRVLTEKCSGGWDMTHAKHKEQNRVKDK
jgi:hypothetical protein